MHESDLDPTLNEGASYFAQVQHIHFADAAAGNAHNNASYRRVGVDNHYSLYLFGPAQTQVMQAAIRAWKDNNPSVRETDSHVPGEGLFILAAKVTDLGTGFFHYEYALQNLNSDRSGGSFAVPLPDGVIIENVGFHDVDYHDGDGPDGQNWDGTDWPATVEVGKITWATTPYGIDPEANALRWSTLYNFRFDANIGPDDSTVTLGLFKPGIPSQIGIPTIGPRLRMMGDFDRDGDLDLFDASGLQACFSGAIENPAFVAPSAECLLQFDFDDDGDVDLADYEGFFAAYTGP